MAFRSLLILSLYILTISCISCAGSEADEQPAVVNLLWYDTPAQHWEEALPVGNGSLGAMIYGGVELEHIQFNEETLWTGEPHEYHHEGAYRYLDSLRQLLFEGRQAAAHELGMKEFMSVPLHQKAYQPLGDLYLRFFHNEAPAEYRRELNLDKATAGVSYRIGDTVFTRQIFASHPDQAIVLNLEADKAGALSFDAFFEADHESQKVYRTLDGDLALRVQVKEGVLFGEAWLQVNAADGDVNVSNDRIQVRNAGQVILILTAATNFKNFREVDQQPKLICQARMDNLKDESFSQLWRNHLDDYQPFFERLQIDLGHTLAEEDPTDVRIEKFGDRSDPSLAALYVQYGRYLMLASSRPGTQPANLQGIWNDKLQPPWESKWTTNINTEMNFWLAEPGNLPECHKSLFQLIDEVSRTGKKTAWEHYRCRGWVLHHNTDIWRGSAPINHSNHGIWVTGGAWLCHHLWEHYLFNQDEAFLRNQAYPLMKGAATFFVDFLVEDPQTGWLISTPSNSPEIGGLVAGPTMDHQIIRSLFNKCIEAAHILDTDQPFADTLKQLVPKIAPNQIGSWGQLQEWLEDKDDPNEHHRHISHLWAHHPGDAITVEHTPELAKAVKTSLKARGDGGTGWSLAWKINQWARFKDGAHCMALLDSLFNPASLSSTWNKGGSYPNLFDAHPPFQIDGNFGAAAGILEMLVQSHAPTIELLPALPVDWPTGFVNGIRARRGFELDLSWENGRLKKCVVRAKPGQKGKITYAGKTVEFILDGNQVTFSSEDFE